MKYEKFLDQIKTAVQQRGKSGIRVTVERVIKNNQDRTDSITILAEGENLAPAIYLEEYYKQYQEGKTIEQIADQIWARYRMHYQKCDIDFSFFKSYEKVKNNIACRLVNYEKNSVTLKQVPHQKFMDLAVVYYYKFDHEILGKGSILIQNTHLDMWNITPEEIHDTALSNTVRLLPYEFIDIASMMEEMLGLKIYQKDTEDVPMYVLTNTEKNYGAVNLLYGSILEAISERLNGDFFVLPSSIHECMIVPVLDWIQVEKLHQMVCEINAEQVDAEEVLSDTVYRYSREEKQLAKAGK